MTGRLLVCMLFAVGACHGPPDDRVVDDPDPSMPAWEEVADIEPLRFAPDPEAANAGDYSGEYPILETRRIITVIPVTAEPGFQYVKLDVYRPAGSIYQTYWRAFTADADPPEFVPHPTVVGQTRVLRIHERDGNAALYLRIPVAGTEITRYRMAGQFRAEVRFGNGDGPAVAAGSFAIMMPEGM